MRFFNISSLPYNKTHKRQKILSNRNNLFINDVGPLVGHLSVALSIWALQALVIRVGASGLYPRIRTPVVLLVALGRAGWNGNQALLVTRGA